jgi:hypothetical protein
VRKNLAMAARQGKRWGLIALAVLIVLIVGGVAGFQVGVRVLKKKVVEALGPDSQITDIRLGWFSVEVEGLRIKGQKGWPAADALRAERVTVVPSLRSFLSGSYQVRSITILKPYLSALRTRDGKLLVVPSLLARADAVGRGGTSPAPGASPPTVTIGRISLQDGVAELFDATVAQPPLKLRLEQIQATVQDVVVPALKGRSQFDLAGVMKGVRRDGRLSVAGWAEIATKDSSVKTELRSMDLVALQPYLIRAGETGVRSGTLDVDLQSDVTKNRLRAPGKVTISDMEFAPTRGVFGTFMGVPRNAVVAFLKDKGNRITMNFVLEGDINNPHFSLNEAIATRLAFSMAETLGVSLSRMAKDVGSLEQVGVEAVGEAAKGMGGAIQRLMRRKP